MIYGRNLFITATVSYDFIYDSFYTRHDYDMIFNRKGSEAVAALILCCIYHLLLYRWRRRRHHELLDTDRAGAG